MDLIESAGVCETHFVSKLPGKWSLPEGVAIEKDHLSASTAVKYFL